MQKKIIYTHGFLKDSKEVYDFIRKDSRENANKFLDILKEKILVLEKFPKFGFEISENKRKLILHKNYYILYELRKNKVYIISLRHSKLE